MADMKQAIATELTRAFVKLGAESELLALVNSYGDTLPDEEILSLLRSYNDHGTYMAEIYCQV